MMVKKEWCLQNKISMEFLIAAFEGAEELDPASIEEKVCKKYIEIQNVKKVATWFNELGERLEDGTKYDGKDVSAIVKGSVNRFSDLASCLHDYNNKLQNGNTSVNTLIKGLISK